MAIAHHQCDRKTFGKKINEVVSPSHPVLSIRHLKGREKQLERIQQALYATGRNVFIYGERGVGKSSLAATAANEWTGGETQYLHVAFERDSTIFAIIASIASQAIHQQKLKKTKLSVAAELKLNWFSVKASADFLEIDFKKEITSLNDAIEVLKEIAMLTPEPPVVVVDEVDILKNHQEIERLADLLKQLGDKRVEVKFIFTGIGSTLNEILGSHGSAIRQLETIQLPKLDWEARWAIAVEALAEFGVSIDDQIYHRIALISDGYPFYIHKLVEQLLWVLFDKDTWVNTVEWDDYYAAIKRTVANISAELAQPYQDAINQRSRDYEEVVWSTVVADDNIGVYMKDMYESYKYIMQQLPDKIQLEQTNYASRIRNLLKDEYGPILAKGLKPGQYIYNEKMLRGYVRLIAEDHKIKLIEEDSKELKELKFKTHATAKSTRIYFSKVPKGYR